MLRAVGGLVARLLSVARVRSRRLDWCLTVRIVATSAEDLQISTLQPSLEVRPYSIPLPLLAQLVSMPYSQHLLLQLREDGRHCPPSEQLPGTLVLQHLVAPKILVVVQRREHVSLEGLGARSLKHVDGVSVVGLSLAYRFQGQEALLLQLYVLKCPRFHLTIVLGGFLVAVLAQGGEGTPHARFKAKLLGLG